LRVHFNVNQACEEIRHLNDVLFAANDFLVAREFTPYEVIPPGEAARAVLIVDGLWATQLFRDRGALERMRERYERSLEDYRPVLQRLRGISLADNPCEVYREARILLQTLLEPTEPGGRQHYSFASKLFHWHAPEHLPIVDSRARRAINILQKGSGQKRGIVFSSTFDETYVEEYGRWIRFYSQLIRSLTPDDCQRLVTTDCESLPIQFRRTNSLLRVLDKVFYYRGGQANETA
jgi:hypothetical protein